MRSRLMLVIMFVLLTALVCIATSASAQTSLVDKYISKSQGNYTPTYDTRFPSNPRSSRELWESKNEASEEVNDTKDVTTETVVETPTANETSNTVDIENYYPTSSSETSSTPISGDISLSLMDSDSSAKRLELHLYEVEDLIFGHGNLYQDNESQRVLMVGEIKSESLQIDVLTEDTTELLRLLLFVPDLYGSYQVFGEDGMRTTGAVNPISG